MTDHGWALVELMGHRTRIGRVAEAEQFGTTMLRIEVDGDPEQLEYYSSSAIFSIRVLTEEAARELIAGRSNARWAPLELEAFEDDLDDEDDHDPDPF